MKIELSACIIGLCALSTGCNIAALATRNLVYETTLCCNDMREGIRHRRLANSAWGEIERASSGGTYSADYARGFKVGFADTLDAGGTMAPPLVRPPGHRWRPRYQTPQDYQALNDWYAGFQHGAAVAQARSDDGLVHPSETTGQEGSPQPTGNDRAGSLLPILTIARQNP